MVDSVWRHKKDGRLARVFSVIRPWSNTGTVEERVVFNNEETGRHGSLLRSRFERDWAPVESSQ